MAGGGCPHPGGGAVIRRLPLAAALLVSALTAAAAQPSAGLPLVSAVRDAVVIEGKSVPLPAGEWIPAALGVPMPGVASLSLLQVRDGRVAGALLVQASRAGGDAGGGWGTASACRRTDLPFARVRYASDHDGSCAWTAVVEGTEGVMIDPAWAGALTLARGRGWSLPQRWGAAAIRVSDPVDAIQVRYALPLDPGAGLPPGLTGWTEAAWERVERGKLNQPAAVATPLPPLDDLSSPPSAVSDGEEEGGLPRAVWKTLTFRGIVTTLDFTTNVLVIGNVVTAALLSAWGTVTGPWIYLAHELAWDHYGTPAEPQLDLPGIGVEGAGS